MKYLYAFIFALIASCYAVTAHANAVIWGPNGYPLSLGDFVYFPNGAALGGGEITTPSGVAPDESGQDVIITAGSATADDGAGIAGKVILKAGVNSGGSGQVTMTLNSDTNQVDVQGGISTNGGVNANASNIGSNEILQNRIVFHPVDPTFTLRTEDNPSGSSAGLNIHTGSAGAGNSGDIQFLTNTASGIRGQISMNARNVLSYGDLKLVDLGKGIAIKEGANGKQGAATLAAGTATVINASVLANSRIFLTCQDPNGGTPGSLYVSARTAATSFTITSTNAGDTCIVAYEMFEQSP